MLPNKQYLLKVDWLHCGVFTVNFEHNHYNFLNSSLNVFIYNFDHMFAWYVCLKKITWHYSIIIQSRHYLVSSDFFKEIFLTQLNTWFRFHFVFKIVISKKRNFFLSCSFITLINRLIISFSSTQQNNV